MQKPDLHADPNKVPDTTFTRQVAVAAACLANSTHCQCYTKEGVDVPRGYAPGNLYTSMVHLALIQCAINGLSCLYPINKLNSC
jgi:hypothetical protein